MYNKSAGNVLFLILIVVALFAALSYAISSSTRGGGNNITAEKAALEQGKMDSYMAAINTGTMRLKMRGCEVIDYTIPADWIASGDKKCFLFHPDGGSVIYQGMGVDDCALQGLSLPTLNLGQGCNGVIYTGSSSGKRLYVKPSDQATLTNFDTGSYVVSGASSGSDGMANTNILIAGGSRYTAANLCRALGPDWYLPSRDESLVIYTNKDTAGLTASLKNSSYWTSTETLTHAVFARNLSSGSSNSYLTKNSGAAVRCVRSD